MGDKKSKITKSVFSNEWTNPGGGTTYYYDIEFENGDKGAVGVSTKDSDRVLVGQNVMYKMNGNKIKITEVIREFTSSKKTYGKKLSHDSFLGYSWSYAKDMVVAGKTMEDVEELNNMARYIYNEIGKMLNE